MTFDLLRLSRDFSAAAYCRLERGEERQEKEWHLLMVLSPAGDDRGLLQHLASVRVFEGRYSDGAR